MKKKQWHTSRLQPIAQIIARVVQEDPSIADRPAELMAILGGRIQDFNDKTKCLNCGASMAEYANFLDINDCLLIYSMGRILDERLAKGIPFTEANKIRVSSANIHHTQKCRTTKCSKLGLIAKAGDARWAITSRGFEGLRGQPVDEMRVTFRGQILERPEKKITFAQVFAEHRAKMDGKERRGKSLREDHRAEFAAYNPSDWVKVAGFNDGQLFK